jgi:two-component system sensor histidine kinase DesK
MDISRWWSGRPGVERFDLSTRWPLYLLSASEPVMAVLLLGAQQRVRAWGAAVLLLVTLAHTVACLRLLRAGIAARLGGPRPATLLVGVAVGLTAAGLAAGAAAFPAYGRLLGEDGFPVGLAVATLFCGALTVAVTPVLPGGQLLAAVAVPAAVTAVLQAATGNTGSQTPWALNYLLLVGPLVFMYRSSTWVLGVVWEIDRARDVQARLAVAEERLRVARDLHDVLGRNLALIAVNSELAAQLARRGQDDAAERMLEVRQVAQDSMREVRDVVGGHRSADLDSELAGARSVLRSAGITARVIGDGSGMPRDVQAALGWTVREATTNIIRHADSTTVRIELDVVPDVAGGFAARLRIENDGVRARHSHPVSGPGDGHGTGLAGLRERLAHLGGTLTAETLPGGRFGVQVLLPMSRRPAGREPATEPVP